jgi:CDP-2,3-bis-(O-geranylgeranyl)-sn-glycerol synthase
MTVVEIILTTFWLFFPAMIANSTPIVAAKLPWLRDFNYPIDFYKTYRGIRIFGDHKTIRGMVTGVLAALAVGLLQNYIFLNSPALQDTLALDFVNAMFLYFVLLTSVGALLGDMIESFVKRQLEIAPGKPWVPFDQIDYILGAILLSLLSFRLNWEIYLCFLFIGVAMHLLASVVAYFTGLRKTII